MRSAIELLVPVSVYWGLGDVATLIGSFCLGVAVVQLSEQVRL